jgi:hypothetical protein
VLASTRRQGGVLGQSLFSLISTGMEMMNLAEAKMSMVGKARARLDQVRELLDTVAQRGAVAAGDRSARPDNFKKEGHSLDRTAEYHAGRWAARTRASVQSWPQFVEAILVSAPMPIPVESLIATTRATIAVGTSLLSGRPEQLRTRCRHRGSTGSTLGSPNASC